MRVISHFFHNQQPDAIRTEDCMNENISQMLAERFISEIKRFTLKTIVYPKFALGIFILTCSSSLQPEVSSYSSVGVQPGAPHR